MSFRRLLSAPVIGDDERSHQAWMLHFVLWSTLLGSNLIFIFLILTLPQYLSRWVASILVVDILNPSLMVLNRKGQTRLASIVLVVVFWMLATALALTGNGIHAPVTIGYAVDTLIAGLLFGEKVGVFSAAFFSLTLFVLAGLEETDLLADNVSIRTPLSIWGIQTFYLALIASYQFLANRSIKAALGRARQELAVRHQTEAALRESELRYREVFERTSDFLFLLDVLPDGHFRFNRWNPSCEKASGIPSVELAGKMPEDVFSPEEAQRITANYKRCITEVCPISYEESLTLGGKTYVFYTTLIPIKNVEGQIHRIVGVAHNITQQKRAEAELRESENRYRIVVEQTGQMIYDYDVRSGEISWRGAIPKITGFTVEEFQQVNIHKWEEMIHPADRSMAMAALHEAMRTVSAYNMEYRFRCKDGGYIWVVDHGLFLPGACGKPIRMLGAMADITARVEAEAALLRSHEELERVVQARTAELQKANKELEAFTYSVSHDLRAPLRAVDGFTDLLMEEYGPKMPEDARQLLSNIKAGSTKMTHLIQDLLNLSRVDRQLFTPTRVNIANLARETFEELHAQKPERDIEFRLGELPDCKGDPFLLRQVFANLLSNAIKFTGTRAKAVIEVGYDKTKGAYFVRDNGVGFDMQFASKLFGVFQRLHPAEQFTGTGVGLSIVQRIIHRHGGKIWAEAAVDRGATFYFTLPPAEPEHADTSEKAEQPVLTLSGPVT